jgi:hypothetical protein
MGIELRGQGGGDGGRGQYLEGETMGGCRSMEGRVGRGSGVHEKGTSEGGGG